MATKQYTSVTTTRTARPRSKRLRLLGGTVAAAASSSTSGLQSYLSNQSNQAGHTHSNLSDLDRISFDESDYLLVQDATEKSKVKAGYADESAEAAHADKADEATHAANADKAAEADHATKADTADEATHAAQADEATHAAQADEADNADKWDGREFDDYLDQPVRKADDVQFGSVTSDRVTSTNYNSGETDGTGWGLTVDSETGKSRLEVDNLLVRMKAVFQELEIRKMTYTGGNVILSGAGSQIMAVVGLDKDGKVIVSYGYWHDADNLYIYIGNSFLSFAADSVNSDASTTVQTYRCYILADDGTTRTRNWWQVGDQAQCRTFNIQEGVHDGVQNKYYWRLVTGVSSEAVALDDGTYYDYVDLANAETVDVTVDGVTHTGLKGYDTSVMTDGNGNAPAKGTTGTVWVDAPARGDSIVQLGNQLDTARQNAIIIETYSEDAPAIKEYSGIDSFSLSGKRRTMISPKGDEFYAEYFNIINASGESNGLAAYLASAIGSSTTQTELDNLLSNFNSYKEEQEETNGALEGAINDNKTATDKAISDTNSTVEANKKSADDGIAEAKAAAKTAQDTADTVSANLTQFTDEQNQVLTGTFEVITDADGNAILTEDGKKQYRLIATSGLITTPKNSGLIYVDDEGNSAAIGVMKTNGGVTKVYLNGDWVDIDSDLITVDAKHIDLKGYTTVNEGFSIDEDGNMTANGAKISGNIEATSGTFNGYLRSAVTAVTDAPYIVKDVLNLIFSTEASVFLPNDPEYVGARVIICSLPSIQSDGQILSTSGSQMVTIQTGRTFVKHLYGMLDGTVVDIPYKDNEATAWTVKTPFKGVHCLAGHSYTNGNNSYLPQGLRLFNGYVELLGIPSLLGASGIHQLTTENSAYSINAEDGTVTYTESETKITETFSEDTVTLTQWVVVGVQAEIAQWLDGNGNTTN